MNVWSLVLLIGGCAGIVIGFARARARAAFALDGFTEPWRRNTALGLLAAVLLLTVALPFAGGLSGGVPETKDFTLVTLFAVHGILLLFLACYFALSGQRSLWDFLKLRSARPPADLGAGFLIGFAGWLLTIVALLIVIGLWYVLRRSGVPAPARDLAFTAVLPPGTAPGRPHPDRRVGDDRRGASSSAPTSSPAWARRRRDADVHAAHGAGHPSSSSASSSSSTVLAVTFTLYGNVLPCIVAHGVFDAIRSSS
jgi:hypothetical protein